MKVSDCRLGFLGFGHMAQVIFKAIDRARMIPRSQIGFTRKDPKKAGASQEEFGITAASLETLVEQSDLLLLCVRPPQSQVVLEDLARIGLEGKMIGSVIAGKTLSFYQKYLGKGAQIVRVMPNIASAVAEGMTLLSFAEGSSSDFRGLTHLLFSGMGGVLEIEERFMDIGTAISGSGPGFVFRLIEAVAQVGAQTGLSYEKALQMAAQTFLGASRLILKGGVPKDLMHQIATPNGTTEAGFKAMSATHLEKDLQAVFLACAKRSKELSE